MADHKASENLRLLSSVRSQVFTFGMAGLHVTDKR